MQGGIKIFIENTKDCVYKSSHKQECILISIIDIPFHLILASHKLIMFDPHYKGY